MKIKDKLAAIFLLLWGFLAFCNHTWAQDALLYRAIQDTTILENKPKINEQNLHYSKGILTKDFDFKLTPVAEGKFAISFPNDVKDIVSIKVYDIIGNTLYENKIRIKGNLSQQIDLSKLKTNFFIVEIKNDQYNKTKSIVAS